MNEYAECIQKVLDYIEERADGEPDAQLGLTELAAVAGFSEYHFHRLFLFMVGDTVMEYVRKRKLARAALRVSHTNERLLDIALDCGFGTQETFIRAFRKLFGMTPGSYRKKRVDTPIYPRAEVVKKRNNPYLGGIRMDYRIEDKPAFQVLAYPLATTNVDGQNNSDIPAFWQKYIREGLGKVLHEATGSWDEYGICTDSDLQTGAFTYLIGMEAKEDVKAPEGTVLRTFPATTYAVFTTPKVKREQFTDSIQQTWNAIYEEWFPHSDYEHSGIGAEYEYYDQRSGDEYDNGLVQMEIYIPVKKKG